MYPNWLGIISVILAFGAFFLTYRYAIKLPIKQRSLLSFLALIFAIPGMSFEFYYHHVIPEMAWYYQFRSIPGTELLVIFVGIACGGLASLVSRIFIVLPLVLVGMYSVAPVIKPFIRPLLKGTMEDRWRDGICFQSTYSTCGPSSVATILNFLGKKVGESQLAIEAHSCMSGTEAWYLARSVRSRGFKARFHSSASFDSRDILPAVFGVKFGTVGHFIPILGMDGENYIVGDPLKGRKLLTKEQLLKKYNFTGFSMTIKKG